MSLTRKATASRLGEVAFGAIRLLFIAGSAFAILSPLLMKLSTAIRTVEDVYDPTVAWIPKQVTLGNFVFAFEGMDYPIALMNSLALTTTLSLIQLAACTLIGYGFARYRARGSRLLFACVVFTLVVPPEMLMIPSYLNFRFFDLYGLLPGSGLNLLGTYWPGIIMSATGVGLKNGLFIYIMRQFFRGMPRDLEEAAHVDGAGPFRTFISVMLPGAVPAMIVVFLFAFVWQWNDYSFTTIFMGSETLLTNKLNELPNYVRENISFHDHHSPMRWILINTGCLMFIAPLLILYAFLQRYFVESVERTGLVG